MFFEGAGAGTGLSLPDTSASLLSSYISACLSPSPLPMTPELLEVHSLLNPLKATTKLAKEVELEEPVDEPLAILAKSVTKILQKQKQDDTVIKNENVMTGFETKAKIKDVGDEHKNVPSCEVCGKIFKKLRWLEHHTKSHLKKSEEAKTPCKECGKDFSAANVECKQHDLKCEECGEQFNKFTTLKMGKLTLKESFEKHMWIHEVVNFKCNCEGIPDLRPGQNMLNQFGSKY